MHGGNIIEISKRLGCLPKEMIDFSASINPYGMPRKVKDALLAHIDDIENYPTTDYSEIKEKLARKHHILPQYIFLGNGANDLIFRFTQCFEKSIKVLLPVPTFSSYKDAVLAQAGASMVYYQMREDLQIREDILYYIKEDINILFLCQPNNPTGTLIELEFLEKILEVCKENHVYVFVDECFMDFVQGQKKYSALSFLDKYYNLVVLRSMTKLYALAGLRFGYIITRNEEILCRLEQITPAWHINAMALKAVETVLDIDMERILSDIENERERIRRELENSGAMVYPSKANFLLFYMENSAKLIEYLLEKKIMVRNCNDFLGLPIGGIRIGIRTREENDVLLHHIRGFYG